MKIYVASLADYNAGRLHGAWINLEDFSDADDVLTHISETILATSPEAAATGMPAEEWAIHDYEDAPDKFGEFESLETLMDIQFWINKLQENGADFEAIAAYCDFFGSDTLDHFEDRYHGEWESEEDYAEDLLESCGYLKEMPENLRYYFNYEKFARDLFISDYVFLDGYVFSQY